MMKMFQRPRVIAVIVAPALFLLLSMLPISNRLLGLIALACLISLLFIAIRASLHRVPEGYVDIISTFGKYRRTLYSGMHLRLPWEKVAGRLRVSERLWVCPPQMVPLSYDDYVILSCTISYQLVPEYAHLAMSATQNWEEFLHQLLITTLQASGTLFVPDDFLSWAPTTLSHATSNDGYERSSPWKHVNLYLLRQIRTRASRWGVQVHWTAIHDVRLAKQAAALLFMEQSSGSPSDSEQTGYITKHNRLTEKLLPRSSNVQSTVSGNRQTGALGRNARIFHEKALSQAYRAVQNGSITSPQTIREVAASFESVAQDTQARETVGFDASLAANMLYERASLYERRDAKLTSESSSSWPHRRSDS